MDKQIESDEVDIFVGGVEPEADALSETSRFIALYKQQPTYQAELEEARKILADLGIDPPSYGMPDAKSLLDHWHRCIADLTGNGVTVPGWGACTREGEVFRIEQSPKANFSDRPVSETQSPARFPTTLWSRVIRAGDPSDQEGQVALELLCKDYWYPLYVFVRRKGLDHDEASDLVQGLFADLIERRDFSKADPARGRFRSFLRTACEHFLANRASMTEPSNEGEENLSYRSISGMPKVAMSTSHPTT